MKYYDETNSAAMSEDDDAVDIESDVSVSTRFGGANRLFREVRVISSECGLKFSLLWIFQDGDDLSADGKSRSANNQYFSQVISIFASTGAAAAILGPISATPSWTSIPHTNKFLLTRNIFSFVCP